MSLVDAVKAHLHWFFVEKYPPGTPEFGLLVWPITMYWVISAFYDLLDTLDLPITRHFKVVRKVRGRENLMTKFQVIRRVILQHVIQFALTYAMFVVDKDQCTHKPAGGWAVSTFQFCLGMFVMDTYQFWVHRAMHVYPFLYKHIHSHHHRLLIPYAYGALYNHPLEALLLDSLGGMITIYAAGLSCEVSTWLMTFATIKTVLDHCGYVFPVNPLHDCFPNCATYHDIHHDIRFIKKNYQQPFFTHWDQLMGSFKTTHGFHILPGEQSPGSGGSRRQSQEAERDKTE